MNILQVYEDEIQSLEKEIKMLTEEYESNQHGSFTSSNRKTKEAMYAFNFCLFGPWPSGFYFVLAFFLVRLAETIC